MNKTKTKKESMLTLAEAAFAQASEKVLQRAEQTGTPIVIWENGRVKKVSPAEMRRRMAKEKRASQD